MTATGIWVLWEQHPIRYRAYCNICSWKAPDIRDGKHAASLDGRGHALSHGKAAAA